MGVLGLWCRLRLAAAPRRLDCVTTVHVVRVFTDEAGEFGNPLGVVLDTTGLAEERRQETATALNFSETVFVEDVSQALLRIFTPATELALAGHPLVGTAWLLSQLSGVEAKTLRPLRAANVDTWAQDGVTWIRARVADAPPWSFQQLDTPAEVDALPFPTAPDLEATEYWSWLDEASGQVRARFFAPSHGVPEDEATGSAALRLVAMLGRPIVIRQGQGSLLYARPCPDDGRRAEVGGRVVRDADREI